MKQRWITFLALILCVLIPSSGSAKVAVYEPVGWAQSSLAKVHYRLNSTVAYVECTLYHADQNGNPTGSPVRYEAYYGETKGYHEHFYYGLDPGSYVAVIETDGVNEAQWKPIVGIYKYDNPTVEYPPPNPAVPDLEGWYGIAINTRQASPYFGWTYVPHKSYQDIYMYRGDGSYVGTMNDAGVYWGGSAPWDACIAGDDYVYIGDRSNRLVYCFKPDGSGFMSCSPAITYSRALFARTDGAGVTHVFVTGGFGAVYEVTVQPDHTTWGVPAIVATLGSLSDDNFKIGGLWVSPDLLTMYVSYDGKIHKFIKQAGVYVAAPSPWPVTVPYCWDLDATSDGSTLWVTSNAAYNPPVTYAAYKVNTTTGAVTPVNYDTTTYGHMVKLDAVGNPAFTYGKSTTSWGQYYWALFTEPGTSSYTTQTNVFTTTSDHLPVMTFYSIQPTSVPGDNTTTATLTAWIYDGAGWADVQQGDVDLSSVGISQHAISTTRVRDPTDPSGKTAIMTITGLKAAVGARVATHNLPLTISDTSGSTSDTVHLQVTGTPVTFTIRHNMTDSPVPYAFARATGGMQGLPGYPYVYTSSNAGTNGQTTMQLSQGVYQVQALRTGYGTLSPVEITVGGSPLAVDLYLRPCTIAEVRALPDSTACNVKAVVYAQTCGPYIGSNPPVVPGLAERRDSSDMHYQWYMCDPNDPGNGLLMLFPVPEDETWWQMDDPDQTETYVGPRPCVGDTILMTGMLGTPSGHERRVKADISLDNKLDIYQNLGNLGGLPVSPIGLTIPEFMHQNISVHPCWGKYAITTGAMVVKNVPSGAPATDGDPIPYIVIADTAGNLAEVAVEKPTTIGFTTWPITGATYNFRGPVGRRNRYGNGCIRVRGSSDMIYVYPAPSPGWPIGLIREFPDGSLVNVEGIVTAVYATCFYIETADRSAGIRVNATVGSYVSRGDIAQVMGMLGVTDGERSIAPNTPVIVHGSSALPGVLSMRNRDLGGVSPVPDNPSITNGRGALNVGLLVKVTGTVTHAGTGFFYIWDGSNSVDGYLDDGSGHYGVRITSNYTPVVAGDRLEITGISTTDTYNVEGRNIPTIMPRDNNDIAKNPALSTVTSPAGTVLSGWNLIGLAAIAGDSTPTQVLAPLAIDNKLFRWESLTGSLIPYDSWSPESFGGMLLGDGFWLQSAASADISYQGRYQSEDQWISLPTPGWALMGQTFNHDTLWSDVKVHNGLEMVSLEEACRTRLWMESTGWWWDNSSQSLCDMALPDEYPASDRLKAWHGYWVQSNTPNISIVVPASPVAP